MLALNPPSSPEPADISIASSPASKLQKINIPRTVILTASLLLPAFAITYPYVTSVTYGQNEDKTRYSLKPATNVQMRDVQDFARQTKQNFLVIGTEIFQIAFQPSESLPIFDCVGDNV